MGARRGNKFGWHSGVLTAKDGRFRGDLYVQDDIVFSDVSAGTLGVTGGIDMQSTTSAIGIDMGGTHSTAAINIDGTFTTGIAINACTDGITFTGAYTDSCIDFSDVTLNFSGSSGPVMIRAGTYGSPVTSSDSGQSGMIRLYGKNTATTDSETSGYYDRGIFVALQNTGSKGMFPISALAEVRTESGNGPVAVMAGQFICNMITSGAKLDETIGVNGMYGAWFKITSTDGATTHASSRKAAVWLDNQMIGNNAVPGEEYTIFATTGGLKPDAFIGFETTSGGWSNFLSFDETAFDQDPIVSATIDSNTQNRYLKVDLNGTAYGIALFEI